MFSLAPTVHTLFPGTDPLENLLESIYEVYHNDMAKVAKAIVKKPELVELAIQNTLIHIGRYPAIQQQLLCRLEENQEKVRSYIYTIVRGRCILILRDERNNGLIYSNDLQETLYNSFTLEDIVISKENYQEITAFFYRSDDINIEVLRMHKDGLTNREIAHELNITEVSVRKRLSRGRIKFSNWMQQRVNLQLVSTMIGESE